MPSETSASREDKYQYIFKIKLFIVSDPGHTCTQPMALTKRFLTFKVLSIAFS